MNNSTSLKIKIKKLREERELSQERFGKKIGISGKSISAYENGRCVPPLKVLEAISRVYDTPAFFISSTGKENLGKMINEIKDQLVKIEKILETNITV